MTSSKFKSLFLKKGTKFTICNSIGGYRSEIIPFEVNEFPNELTRVSDFSISRIGQYANIEKITDNFVLLYSTDIIGKIIKVKIPISAITILEPTESEVLAEKLNNLVNL